MKILMRIIWEQPDQIHFHVLFNLKGITLNTKFLLFYTAQEDFKLKLPYKIIVFKASYSSCIL